MDYILSAKQTDCVDKPKYWFSFWVLEKFRICRQKKLLNKTETLNRRKLEHELYANFVIFRLYYKSCAHAVRVQILNIWTCCRWCRHDSFVRETSHLSDLILWGKMCWNFQDWQCTHAKRNDDETYQISIKHYTKEEKKFKSLEVCQWRILMWGSFDLKGKLVVREWGEKVIVAFTGGARNFSLIGW